MNGMAHLRMGLFFGVLFCLLNYMAWFSWLAENPCHSVFLNEDSPPLLPEPRHKTNHSALAEQRPTLLWGIFSMINSKEEFGRRQLIRDTYLKSLPEEGRICSLYQFQQQQGSCQVAYVFVVGGGNESAPTENLQNANWIQPTLLDSNEDDLLHLNIRENMNDGKSLSYFKYASTLKEFDYIVKCDSDTLVFLPLFLDDFVAKALPPPPYNRRIYAGAQMDFFSCGGRKFAQCRQIWGRVYMSGQLYVLSWDLAQFITSDELKEQREKVKNAHEDITTNNLVRQHADPIALVPLERSLTPWKHHFDSVDEWKRCWKRYTQKGLLPKKRQGDSRNKVKLFENVTDTT